jgi:hypothetical protein
MQSAGSSPVVVTLVYDQENQKPITPPRRVPVKVTEALAHVFAHAAFMNEAAKTVLTFPSVLAAMAAGRDPAAQWLLAELGRQTVALTSITALGSFRYEDDDGDLGRLSEYTTSESARGAIEQAQTIASLLGDAALDVRHLIASYPILQNWHDGDFATLRIDRLEWCRRLGAFMAQTHAAEKWYWSEYADRASPVPLTSFSADVYTERDLLGIDRGVDALALLIASTRTNTPLSIGVFGPWGSGKSFFMRHLRRKIWELPARENHRVAEWRDKRKAGTATPDDAPLYYGQIAQVEFNAWHYNEGNLVASLIDHLFRNLRVGPDKDEKLDERRREVIDTIKKESNKQVAAVAEVQETEKKVEAAKADLAQKTTELQTVSKTVAETAAKVEASTSNAEQDRKKFEVQVQALAQPPDAPAAVDAVNVALEPLAKSPGVAQAKKLATDIAEAMASWRDFLKRLNSPRGMVVLLLCVGAPLVAWATGWFNNFTAGLVGAVTAAAASMHQVIDFMQKRRGEIEKKFEELEGKERDRLDREIAEVKRQQALGEAAWSARQTALMASLDAQKKQLADREADVAVTVAALKALTSQLEAKVQERVDADAHLKSLEQELSKLSQAFLLDEFLKERSGSDDYRKELGLLARVRLDFERLSELIAKANDEWCSPDNDKEPPYLNRIVLYIDDLDRCQVSTVIRVLEMVHLLLAFPLFVCVVAVDPRWVAECLRETHKNVFVGDEKEEDAVSSKRATVGDYLEKIFQIPIWMKPIDAVQRAALVKALLGSTAAPDPKAAPSTPTGERDLRSDPPRRPFRSHVSDSPLDGFSAAVARAEETPDPLRITPEEAEFVDRVGPLLSDRPRALKRFVNTYRLLKASLPDIARQGFVTDKVSSPHRLCISQLALFTGHPRVATALVYRLGLPVDGAHSLQFWLDSLSEADKTLLKKTIEMVPGLDEIRLDEFRAWLPDTTKYLFDRAEDADYGRTPSRPAPGGSADVKTLA